ncbi:MAG: roadblock/LC7 domain-containing protein [Anaerolineales bacterium]|nr:roadblock/LC7 domain-containing protein [Anaerolineales bacterium]
MRKGHSEWEKPVLEQLGRLQTDTGARCVVLLNSSGYPIETAGATNGLDVSSIGALVAANFAAAAELARLLGRGSVFKSSYHEGLGETDQNIFAYNVNGDVLLAVIFGEKSKPGIVWYCTRRTAAALNPLVKGNTGSISLHGKKEAPPGKECEEANGSDELMDLKEAIAAGLLPPDFGSQGDSFERYIADELDSFLAMDDFSQYE